LPLTVDTSELPVLPPFTQRDLRQLRLEDQCVEESGRRLAEFVGFLKSDTASPTDKDHKKRAESALSRSPAGRTLIARALRSTTQALEDAVSRAKGGTPGRHNAAVRHLLDVDLEDAAIATLRILIDGMDRPRDLVGLARKIGHHVYAEKRLLEWAASNRELIRHTLKQFRTDSEEHHYRIVRAMMARTTGEPLRLPPVEELVEVGLFLAHTVREHSGFFEEVTVYEGRKRPKQFRPSPRLLRWLRKNHEARALALPAYAPLLIPPRDWARGQNGGYHYALANSLPFVKGVGWDAANAIRDACGPEPLAAANALQGTAWRINRKVLEAYREAVLSGGHLGGLKGLREKEVPRAPKLSRDKTTWTDAQRERFETWKRSAAKAHSENRDTRHRALLETRTLALAEQLQDEEEFYLAVNADFRGRFYYASPCLNPQGTDAQRSLFEFARAAEHSNRTHRALTYHGASRMGTCPWTGAKLDKLPFAEQEAWVLANSDRIRALGEDWRSYDWWESADDPWQFLAFAFAWADTLRGEPTHLPLQLDGSTNTYQHFAAASRDARLADVSNLRPTLRANAVPSDLYAFCAQRATENQDTLRVRGAGGRLLTVERLLTRSEVKSVVVKIPFGATLKGMADDVHEALLPKLHPEEDTYAVALHLARAILAATFELYPSVLRVSDYIRALTDATNAIGADLAWTTPSGFPASQRYRKLNTKRVRIRLSSRLQYEATVNRDSDILEGMAARTGSVANVMQSLDAAHMHKVAARLGNDIGYIHDCILFPADRASEVHRVLREEFIATHEEPFLERLREEVRRMVGDSVPLPDAPELGDWSLKEVLKSEFFFH
jgi:DNA-directed RNA polymerase